MMDSLNSLGVMKVVTKNTRTLLVFVFIAAVASFGLSFLLQEKYKSTAIVYPVNMYQNSEESNTEQLLQYLMSEEVKNQLAAEFKLYERYGIDTVSEKGGHALFNYMYQENFNISPTLYESIEVSVKDENPVMAKRMNVRLIELTNKLIQQNKLQVVNQYLRNAKKVLQSSDQELDSIDLRIRQIKTQYNIIDEDHQARYVSKEVAKGTNSENLTKQSTGLKEKGAELKILNGKIKSTLRSYTEMKAQYDKYLLDAQGEIDFILYVSKPSLPDKRCYPVRWIIVLVSSLSVLLLGTIVILIRHRIKTVS